MHVVTSWSSSSRQEELVVFAFGTFDGIHLGHQYLLHELRAQALIKGFKTAVLAFSNHPKEVIFPGRKVPRITSNVQRQKLLSDLGVDYLYELPFTQEIAELEPEEFVSKILTLLPVGVWIAGDDIAFGKNRRGNKETLEILGMKRGFSSKFLSKRRFTGIIVSSTAIRKLIQEGSFEEVHKLLGRPFTFVGPKLEGFQIARTLGVPTINIHIEGYALPQEGVWSALVRDFGDIKPSSVWQPAALYIGKSPTLDLQRSTVAEVHLLTHMENNSLPSSAMLEIQPIHFIRPDTHFSDQQQLSDQIHQDIQVIRKYFSNLGYSLN